jgi:hypothetical protein
VQATKKISINYIFFFSLGIDWTLVSAGKRFNLKEREVSNVVTDVMQVM